MVVLIHRAIHKVLWVITHELGDPGLNKTKIFFRSRLSVPVLNSRGLYVVTNVSNEFTLLTFCSYCIKRRRRRK